MLLSFSLKISEVLTKSHIFPFANARNRFFSLVLEFPIIIAVVVWDAFYLSDTGQEAGKLETNGPCKGCSASVWLRNTLTLRAVLQVQHRLIRCCSIGNSRGILLLLRFSVILSQDSLGRYNFSYVWAYIHTLKERNACPLFVPVYPIM